MSVTLKGLDKRNSKPSMLVDNIDEGNRDKLYSICNIYDVCNYVIKKRKIDKEEKKSKENSWTVEKLLMLHGKGEQYIIVRKF